MSTIRDNLMTRAGYSPYCGMAGCIAGWPRATFDGEQFKCRCGWRSEFPADFIAEYKAKWGVGDTSGARCTASRDGDCSHAQCPQLRDNEPAASGRHCPLDNHHEED